MRQELLALALLAMPAWLAGQQPARPDTLHQHSDTLTRRPIELEPVTVTAAPVRRDEPRTTVQVGPEVLQATPAFNVYDLLRQTAGLEVHDQGQGPGFASDASLRGFSSDHSTDIALWVDGVPNNEPVNGHAEGYNDWSLLFPNAVDGVDVLKGPTSALYGNFALAGVVNVHTLERMRGTSVWLDPGSYRRLDGGILTGYDRGANGGVFGIRGLHETGWRPNSAYDLAQGHARLVGALSSSATLDAGVELYGTRWDSPGFLSDSAFEARAFSLVTDPTDGGHKYRAQERVSLKVLVGPSLLWRTTTYGTQGRWQLFLTIPPEPGAGEGTGSQTEEEDRRWGLGLTSALTWHVSRSDITLGTEGRWDRSDFENWLTTARTRDSAQILVAARQASGALFFHSTSDLGRHLRVSVGGRWDVQQTQATPDGGTATSATKGVLSPKLGVLAHVPGMGDVFINLSRGFRQTDGVITDPTLPFITAWAYETGIKFNGQYASGSIGVFRMDVSNEQTLNPLTAESTSGGASRRQGVEVELTARPEPALLLQTQWTFNDAKYRHLLTEEGETLDGARVFNTATYLGTAAMEVAPLGARWRLRLSSNVLGRYTPFDEPGVQLPAYALFHAMGSVRLGSATLELGIRNFLDRAYPEVRAGGFVAPGQPRTVFGSLRWSH